MTMTRTEKATHQDNITCRGMDGYLAFRFASPILGAKAREERGHDRMTASEYAELRMGRRAKVDWRIDEVIAERINIHRKARRRTRR